ncbi:MAG TPA: VCBS repeat-containing protein [Verrucomicrobiae bacterium]|nr:VCBS repeat-containing protein [Verrucomicrobiae bacterium]
MTLVSAGFAQSVSPSAPTSGVPRSGEALSRLYCSTCHVFPEPELLDKKTWRDQTLRRMKIRMGLSPAEIESHPESKLLEATGIFPTSPLISTQDWSAIFDYYVNAAPEAPLPQDPRPPIQVGLKYFRPEPPKYRRALPSTTLVKISEHARRIYMGDAETQSIDVLDGSGVFHETVKLNNIPVSLTESTRGIYVTSIGHFQPSEDPKAELAFLRRGENGFEPPRAILSQLPRATYTEFADLNGDGKIDFLICIYGNNVGRFSWFENLGQNQFREHVLIPKSGAIRAEVHDFNGDGFPDLAVLLAQESESFFILMNDGKGNFSQRPVFQKHPLMGHTYFEMADFNNDGKLDFIVTNGDNGEYPSPMKKYHGIRIYLNKGGEHFEEAYFFPMNGAFKAIARDFDHDGDLDVAAISFFPDYQKSPEESFIYLENQGGLRFTPSTFEQCVMGRWLTMDAGDLDGDGDLDIVLGSYIRGPSPVPSTFSRNWEADGPSVLILRNHIKEPL